MSSFHARECHECHDVKRRTHGGCLKQFGIDENPRCSAGMASTKDTYSCTIAISRRRLRPKPSIERERSVREDIQGLRDEVGRDGLARRDSQSRDVASGIASVTGVISP